MLHVSAQEKELIFKLAEKLTGCNIDMRREIFVQNVARRAELMKAASVRDYLVSIRDDDRELPHLVSALTIHTTSWFREQPHFRWLETHLRKSAQLNKQRKIRLLSAGCSTAQEIYSFGLVLELMRRENVIQDYSLVGWDIDLIVLDKAAKASYSSSDLQGIEKRFHHLLHQKNAVSSSEPGFFTIDQAITQRTQFQCVNITSPSHDSFEAFDFVICRNVLIYFRPNQVSDIVDGLLQHLRPDGYLILGHGESINALNHSVAIAGPTVYSKTIPHSDQIKVATHQLPSKRSSSSKGPSAILIGASTGGPEALGALLAKMPPQIPPIIVVQHIAADFMSSLGRHLSITSGLNLVLVKESVPLEANSLYMTVGDCHLMLEEKAGRLYVGVSHKAPRHGHRPSIDEFFHSAVPFGPQLVAILLTGMGKDGAEGLLRLKEAGALTMAQDEKSSVVYGMPKEAFLLGAPLIVGSPQELRHKLEEILQHHFAHVKDLITLKPAALPR